MYDVLIIGAGVSGCACARELSRYDARVLVIDKEDDVCCGTSKANSAIVHAGYDASPGSLMAKLNVEGNALMGALAEELDIPFRRNGSFVVCFSEEDRPGLVKLLEQGRTNGVPDLRILERHELIAMEPGLSDDIVAALYAPTAGIICPFTLTVALAENAAANGVEFRFNTAATDIRKVNGGFVVDTDRGPIATRAVINAAGVYSDKFHNIFGAKKFHITPRRGDYCLLDRAAGRVVDKTIFPLPGKFGKGILVAPTVHGNTILGPTAIDLDDPEATATTAEGIAALLAQAKRSVKDLPLNQIITSFAGLRAHEDGHEFVIGELSEVPGFFDCAGIESPGLTSSPAIGKRLAKCCAGFGMALTACDPQIDPAYCRENGIESLSFSELLRRADVISLHLPLNDQTRHIIGREAITQMRDGAIVVNTSRGAIVDEDAAYEALVSGKLGGLGLDAFEVEPPVNCRLMTLDNVVTTPHTGAHTIEAIRNMQECAVDNLITVLSGHPCRNIVS